jgi:hypothetical protein
MWDLNVVEEEETIVHGVVTKFGSNITNVDPLQGFVSLHVPDLANERMWTVFLAIND